MYFGIKTSFENRPEHMGLRSQTMYAIIFCTCVLASFVGFAAACRVSDRIDRSASTSARAPFARSSAGAFARFSLHPFCWLSCVFRAALSASSSVGLAVVARFAGCRGTFARFMPHLARCLGVALPRASSGAAAFRGSAFVPLVGDALGAALPRCRAGLLHVGTSFPPLSSFISLP